jgi:hypothetical protein
MNTSTYTVIAYQYRDADNHKEQSHLIADGKITRQQAEAMQALLWQDDSFIPTQLGLGHLGTDLDGFPADGDHLWHEIDLDDIETGNGSPDVTGTPVGPITAFVNRFVAEGRKGWDDTATLDDL